jgi:hypothetical protein
LNICLIHTHPPEFVHGLASLVTGFSRFGFGFGFAAGIGDGASPVSVCVLSIHVSRRAHSGADGHLIFVPAKDGERIGIDEQVKCFVCAAARLTPFPFIERSS